MTIRKISFRNIRGTRFPSAASLATPLWKDYEDNIEIPAIVLMESMGTEAAQVVFLSMRNMDKLLEPSSEKQRDLGKKIVNSQVMHLSFGERSDLVRLQSPVRKMFKHQTVSDVNNPRCVLWDRSTESWNSRFCEIVFSVRHTGCKCSKVGSFGLLEDIVKKDSMAKTTFLVMVIVAVAVSTIVIISIVLVAVYCYRIKVREDLTWSYKTHPRVKPTRLKSIFISSALLLLNNRCVTLIPKFRENVYIKFVPQLSLLSILISIKLLS